MSMAATQISRIRVKHFDGIGVYCKKGIQNG